MRRGSVAGELLAQCGQRLVGGEGALGHRCRRTGRAALVVVGGRRRARLRGVRGGVAATGGLRVGLGERLDLGAVRLPAGVRLGVLLLPGLALLLEALEPLVGLRVEALGVLVVTLLVVLGGQAVQGRVELDLVGAVLVRLLQRQRDAATLEVDVDDLDEDVGAHGDDLLRQLHVALGQLGDVDQALDAVVDAHERTERDELGDLARDDLTDRVGPGEVLPRVLLRRLQRQGDPLAVHVDVQNLDRDLLADLDDLGRVVDVLPGQLGDVHQAVDATEVHERTEVDDAGDDAGADLTLLQLLEERGAHLGLGLLEPGTAGQDHVVAVLVQLDDLGLDLLAHVGLEVADATHLDERGGKEAAEADVEDESTLDDLDDGAGDDAVLLLDLLDGAPGTLVLSALRGQDQPAFLVLLLENQGLDLIAHGNDLGGVDVLLDGELAGGDDTLGLVPDVEQDLVPVDLDDDTFDDVSVIEVLDRRIDRGEQFFLRPDVVDRDLGAGLLGRAGSHVVGAPLGGHVVEGPAHRTQDHGGYRGA